MREQESKYDTYSFIEISTNFMFSQMSEEAGINKFVWEAVVDMVKEYN